MLNEAIFNNDQPENRYQCHHVFPDGARCGSPRMRNEQFCYFHHDTRRPVARPSERIARQNTFSLFTPATHDSIQESLGELLVRIATNDIDHRRAGLLLYCLSLSATNLRSIRRAQQSKSSTQPPTNANPEQEPPSPPPETDE